MKAVKVKTKPKGAPWWPNGLGLQAFNCWGPGSIPGLETEIPQAKQLRKKKKKTKHMPQDVDESSRKMASSLVHTRKGKQSVNDLWEPATRDGQRTRGN